MDNNKINVLVLSNGEYKKQEIPNTLESLQKIVGGYIEIPYFGSVFADCGIDVIINEEGKFIDGLRPEIAIMKNPNTILDIVYGNCIFASHDDEGNTTSITDNQIEVIMDVINWNVILNGNGKTNIVKGAVFY